MYYINYHFSLPSPSQDGSQGWASGLSRAKQMVSQMTIEEKGKAYHSLCFTQNIYNIQSHSVGNRDLKNSLSLLIS